MLSKKSDVTFTKLLNNKNKKNTDNKEVVDYAWVAADEMRNFMKPKYVDALQGIIM